MATLSKEQVQQIIQNAPAGTTPQGIISGLREAGHTLDGYVEPQIKKPGLLQRFGDVGASVLGGLAKYSGIEGVVKSVAKIPGEFVASTSELAGKQAPAWTESNRLSGPELRSGLQYGINEQGRAAAEQMKSQGASGAGFTDVLNIAALTPGAGLASKGVAQAKTLSNVSKFSQAVPAIKEGAKEGAKWMAAYGAAEQLDEGGSLGDIIKGAAVGGTVGAIGGGALGFIPLGFSSLHDTLTVPKTQKLLTSAIKPSKTALDSGSWGKSLDTTIKELAPQSKNITDLATFEEAIKNKKKDIWAEVTARVAKGVDKNLYIDGNKIANAVSDVITSNPKIMRENPQLADQIISGADAYRGKIPVSEVENIIERSNAELQAYYKKNNINKSIAEKADPKIEASLTLVTGLRTELENELSRLGAPVADLKNKYGALSTVGREVSGRRLVAERANLTSLAEQLSFAEAIARGFSRGEGVVGGVAQAVMAKVLKHLETSDVKIQRAFGALKQPSANKRATDRILPSKAKKN